VIERVQFQVWEEEQSIARRDNFRRIEEKSMQNTNAEVGTGNCRALTEMKLVLQPLECGSAQTRVNHKEK
jgi:hypothetical protein